MRSTRALIGAGILCLTVAGSSLVIGFTDGAPWLTIAAGALGSILLIAGLVGKRAEAGRRYPILRAASTSYVSSLRG
jgi:hypothetical protein